MQPLTGKMYSQGVFTFASATKLVAVGSEHPGRGRKQLVLMVATES